jgi:glycine/D-amino acid oxidase-like deaminating enzyme
MQRKKCVVVHKIFMKKRVRYNLAINPSMKKEKSYDTIVIGAGIAGLSSAYHMQKIGHKVLVLEAGSGKDNASFASDAIISHDPDARWDQIMSRFGLQGAKQVFDISEKGIQLLFKFAKSTTPNFDGERLPGYVFSLSRDKSKKLFRQYQIYKKIGIPVEYEEDGSRLHKNFDSYLTILNEGQSNNQAILKNLGKEIRTHGGKILLHTEVIDIESEKSGVKVHTDDGKLFEAKEVIVATGDCPKFLKLSLPIETKRTFVIEYRKHKMPALYTSSTLWDNEEPYHYIRSFRKFILWVGGADVYEKDYDPKKDYFSGVEAFSRKKLLLDETFERKKQWSGKFFPAKRGLPYIGKVPGKPVWLNLGFGGTGIVTTFVSGYLLASWKRGKEKKYQRLFSLD